MSQEGDSVFTSRALESALANKDLKSAYEVPQSAAERHISQHTTGMPLPEQKSLPTDVGLNAGLGIKRKKEMSEAQCSEEGGTPSLKRAKKPKTLSEKREKLEQDILKYGVAAIEKLYPRQGQPPQAQVSKKGRRGPRAGIKMKAKAPGPDYKEVDAQSILRPFSHDKYIHEPPFRSVVYVRRRRAMIPLSSLSKDSRTILSSDARLLAGRNVTYGRPSLFVKEEGRVIAIGGSRNKENDLLRVIPVPNMKSRLARSQSSMDFVPFYMDEEFASIAAGAVQTPKKKPKIDIRTLKKIQRKQSTDLKKVLQDKSIVDHVYDKMKSAEEAALSSSKDSASPQESSDQKLCEDPDPKKGSEEDSCKIFNRLLDSTSSFTNPLPDPEGRPVTSTDFQAALKERNKKEFSGYENCDIEDCFCRDSLAVIEVSTPATDGTQTPESSVHTPVENKGGQHVVKNLKKVKRALKTLGVNLLEFESQNGLRKDCDRDFCRLGCICDTLLGSPVLPNHCSKVECMFRCHCSEETLKKLSSSRKVAISPSAFTNFQDKSPPNVVTTGGRDLIMLSGRQKRERKMPTRYQDTDALSIESVSSDFLSKSEDVLNLDTILVPGKEDPNIVKMISSSIKEGVSRKCTVLVPKINLSQEMDVKPWCMFHCRHSCPCFKYENPLDYGPDLSKSRNVARRSTKFISPICLDDDEEDDLDGKKEENTSKRAYPVRRNQCARTEGFTVTPSFKLKMPHKFVTVKESVDVETQGDVIKVRLPKDDKKTVIDLTIKPIKTKQYINWYVLRYIFTHDIVRIWYFTRNGKFVFFISRFSSPAYTSNSSCVKELIRHTSDINSLPIFARELVLTKESERSSSKFAILTSSGISWEITGILQKKAEKQTTPSPSSQPKEQAIINLALSSQRLSPGQNLVTVVHSKKAVMQIKLPETSPNQYWYTLGVPQRVDAVPCPEKPFNIKTTTIVQAAGLANSKNTTVRVPIESSDDTSSSFGIYAVPCLDNHVFVGPYSVKEVKDAYESPEVICLDDEDTQKPVSAPSSYKNQTSSSGCRRKQKLTTKYDEIDRLNNEKLVTTLVESVANKAVTFGERRRKRKLSSARTILGSVPEVVSQESGSSEQVLVANESNEPKLQSDVLKESLKKNEELPCYQNLPKSKFGKTVRGKIDENDSCVVLLTSNQESFKVYISFKKNGVVQFNHPSFPNHIVMCKDVENASKWMDEYKKDIPEITSSVSLKEIPAKDNKQSTTLDNEERSEYIQSLFKLRKSLMPEHDSSLMYTRVEVINIAREMILDFRNKFKFQEFLKKKLLDRRSYLFDTFTKNLKDLPIEMKKKFVFDLKLGLKKKGAERVVQEPAPPPVEEQASTPPPSKILKKGSSMPALIPIAAGENKQPETASKTVAAPSPPEEKKRRRPLNAFMLWAKKQRPQLISSGLTTVELSRMLVDKWHQLSQKERLQYQIEAERLKNLSLKPFDDKPDVKVESKQQEDGHSDATNNPHIIEISLD